MRLCRDAESSGSLYATINKPVGARAQKGENIGNMVTCFEVLLGIGTQRKAWHNRKSTVTKLK